MKYEPKQEDYNKYVNQVTPKSNSVKNCIWAFLAGGGICLAGQIIKHILMANNVSEDDAYGYVSIILVLASVVLTGLNLYKGFAKFAGAGALVPITGFANGVCSPIVEFQTEGEVFGKGVKAFTIAGPVIMFGIFASFIAGLIYYIIGLF